MAQEVARRSLVVTDVDEVSSKPKRSRKKTRSSSPKRPVRPVSVRGKKQPAKPKAPVKKKAFTKSGVKSTTKAATRQTATGTKKPTKTQVKPSQEKTRKVVARSVESPSPKRQAKRAQSVKKSVPEAAHKKRIKALSAETRVIKPASKRPVPDVTRRDQLGHLLIEQLLRASGFSGTISTSKTLLETYSTDESIFSITPQLVLQPQSARDVAAAATVVARETKRFTSLSLTPRAAGTGLSGGSLTDSVVLDVSRYLTHIGEISFHTGEARITCEPGVMWRDMERRLKRAGYYIPSYPSSKDICSVGGAVGNNAAGAETLRHGHTVDWVESLDVVFHDGSIHTVSRLTYKQFKALTKQSHAYAVIAQKIFDLIEQHEKEIQKNRPRTRKNTAGYDIWDVLPQGVKAFKQGKGLFDPVRLLVGSQGTVGIIVNITLRAIPLPATTTLICVPIYDIHEMPSVVEKVKRFNPLEIEVFDDRTYDLALQNPDVFKRYAIGLHYYRLMFAMYTTYHIRCVRELPPFMMLIRLDDEQLAQHSAHSIVSEISSKRNRARIVTNPIEEEMLWIIHRASYTLSKLQDYSRRPAAFLEDMTVPLEQLPKFLTEVKRLFREYNLQATVHGHAGDGHFHFYPLLDFTNKTTPALIEKMSEAFFSLAVKHSGSICGEHNDGIIRTPHLNKMFSKKMLALFGELENIFDPDDIFNPGKKVNPRFEVREVIRTTNN